MDPEFDEPHELRSLNGTPAAPATAKGAGERPAERKEGPWKIRCKDSNLKHEIKLNTFKKQSSTDHATMNDSITVLDFTPIVMLNNGGTALHLTIGSLSPQALV